MATSSPSPATSSIHHFGHTRRPLTISPPNRSLIKVRRTTGGKPSDNSTRTDSSSVTTSAGSESGNLFIKTAWYASELLGIAASFFRSPQNVVIDDDDDDTVAVIELAGDGLGFIDRSLIFDTIKQDFQRSYFVTGAVTVDAYEDDCEFADPAGSFKGVGRFKRNCTNFGSLIQKSNMKLMKWQDFEDKGIGHWRFSCTMSFPWKPILSATGYTEYYLSKESGKVCRHVEHWNVPKMALFKQLLKPSRGFWGRQ